MRARVEAAAAAGATVRWLGALPHDQTMAFVRHVDVICLPSYSEGFATVVLEAAAVGTPVVATKVGGAVDVIADADHGLLVDDHAPATIAAGLIRALSDSAWREAAARRAQQRVSTEFTWERTADRFVRAATDVCR
jgi:glycosyltransferase involved in cell wall biosynthesis